jgi:hypothetical protein
MKNNFIDCNNSGTLRIKLSPFISFLSESDSQLFHCWFLQKLIYIYCQPNYFSLSFKYFSIKLETNNDLPN